MLNGRDNTMLSKQRKYTVSDFIKCRLLLEEHLGGDLYVKYSIGKFHLDAENTLLALKEELCNYGYSVTVIMPICETEFNSLYSCKDITDERIHSMILENKGNELIVISEASMRGYSPITIEGLHPKDHFTYREVKHLLK